jgi:hypothetical protein
MNPDLGSTKTTSHQTHLRSLNLFRFKKARGPVSKVCHLTASSFVRVHAGLVRDSVTPFLATHTLFSALKRCHSSPLDHRGCSHCAVGGASRLCSALDSVHALHDVSFKLPKCEARSSLRACEVLGSSVLVLT